jgi:hypothetical protein
VLRAQKGVIAMSMFTQIKRALVRAINETDVTGIEDYSFSVTSKWYPSGVINWFYKQGLFKVANVETVQIRKGYKQYIVTVKEIDLENKLFKNTGVRGRLTRDNTDNTEFGYYSTGRVDQASLYENEEKYEHISPEDSCITSMVIQAMGFRDYADFVETLGEGVEAREILNDKVQEFYENYYAPEHMYSEVEVEA